MGQHTWAVETYGSVECDTHVRQGRSNHWPKVDPLAFSEHALLVCAAWRKVGAIRSLAGS